MAAFCWVIESMWATASLICPMPSSSSRLYPLTSMNAGLQ